MKLSPALAAMLAAILLAPAVSLADDPITGLEFKNRFDQPPPIVAKPAQNDKATGAPRSAMKGGDAVDAKDPVSMQACADVGGRVVPQGSGSVCFVPIR